MNFDESKEDISKALSQYMEFINEIIKESQSTEEVKENLTDFFETISDLSNSDNLINLIDSFRSTFN